MKKLYLISVSNLLTESKSENLKHTLLDALTAWTQQPIVASTLLVNNQHQKEQKGEK